MTEKKTILLDELIATRFLKVEQKEIQMMADRLLQKNSPNRTKAGEDKNEKVKTKIFC